jgi:hypothetical protein
MSNEALGFFLGQDLLWCLQNGAPRKPCGPWVLGRLIGWTLISIFLGLVQKSQIFLNRHKFQENFKRKIKMIKLSFH